MTKDQENMVGTATVFCVFGQAIEALKLGKRIQRKGWDGKGMYVFKQIPAEVPNHIISKMTSVPQSVKDNMAERKQPLTYKNQLALVQSDGTVDSWAPSSIDIFADDWIILE